LTPLSTFSLDRPDYIAPSKPKKRYFGHNDLAKLVRGTLRDASKPLSAGKIAVAIMAAKGFQEMRYLPIAKMVVQRLNRSAAEGAVVKTGKTQDARWASLSRSTTTPLADRHYSRIERFAAGKQLDRAIAESTIATVRSEQHCIVLPSSRFHDVRHEFAFDDLKHAILILGYCGLAAVLPTLAAIVGYREAVLAVHEQRFGHGHRPVPGIAATTGGSGAGHNSHQ
jgi:hypothetical protein